MSRRKGTITTGRDTGYPPAPDLVARNFTAAGPDQLWGADITYIPTWAGVLYLAVVLDAWKVAGSSAGRWPRISAPSSSSMRPRWPRHSAGPHR